MTLMKLALATTLLLGASPTPGAAPPPSRLPRSSIAAVLQQRDELHLDEAQVKQLEARDDALQRKVADLRQQLAATASQGRGHGRRPDGARDGPSPVAPGDPPPPQSPAAAARPEGTGLGGGLGRHGGGGGHRGAAGASERLRPDPAALQAQIDDADTAAWLAAESSLREPQREPARAVAERYREALADEREKAGAGR